MNGSIWVVGAGGIGSGIAARLSAAGDDVVVLDPWVDHVDAIGRDGLRLEHPGGTVVGHPTAVVLTDDASAAVGGLAPPALVLLAVKSDRTASTLEPLVPWLAGAPVVSLQNGLNEPVIEALVGADATIGAVVRFDGALLGPGRVAQSRDDGDLVIGAMAPGGRAAAAVIAERLRPALPVVLSDDVRVELWSKLARNCMLNGIATLAGLGLGHLAEVPAARRACLATGLETIRVAAAEGIDVAPETMYGADIVCLLAGDATAVEAFDTGFRRTYRATPDIKPSMLQDFEKGRAVEVEHLNGAVARAGAAVGVPTPVNERVVDAVLALVRGELTQGTDQLEALT